MKRPDRVGATGHDLASPRGFGRYRLAAVAETPALPDFDETEDLEWSVHTAVTLTLTDPAPPPAAPALPRGGLLLLALLLAGAGWGRSSTRRSRTWPPASRLRRNV